MSAIYFHVAPRYTGGSPAQVDEATARRVAAQEQHAYEQLVGDPDLKDSVEALAAAVEGAAGIVEQRTERADCWIVLDLITGAEFVRPFPVHPESEARARQRAVRLRTKYHLPLEGDSVAWRALMRDSRHFIRRTRS